MKRFSTALRTSAVLALSAMLLVTGCGQKSAAKPSATPAASAPAASTAPATSDKWAPDKAVSLMVMAAPGGSTDLLARAVEKVWKKYCPQEILVVNKAGAGGVEAANFVAKSKPDGYTLLMGYGSGNDLVMPHLQANMPYKPLEDLAAVSRLSVHSVVVAVPVSSPFKTIKDVVDQAKKDGKPVTAAVSTTAGAVDFVMRGIGAATGITVTPVPHQGGSQALTTLMGGQTIIGGGHPPEVMPFVASGKLRAIGVALKERDSAIKDVPTLIEQGINLNTWGSVKGIAVSAKTPKNIIDYYDNVFKQISADEDYKKQMQIFIEPVDYLNSADFTKFMKEAYDDYGKKTVDYKIPKQ